MMYRRCARVILLFLTCISLKIVCLSISQIYPTVIRHAHVCGVKWIIYIYIYK